MAPHSAAWQRLTEDTTDGVFERKFEKTAVRLSCAGYSASFMQRATHHSV